MIGSDPNRAAAVLDEALRQRLEETVGQARRLLGQPSEGRGRAADATDLREAIATLAARLEDRGDAEAAQTVAIHEAQLARLRARYGDRVAALERIADAVSQLREISVPATMLTSAPRTLCEHSAFERALVSVVHDGEMVAEAMHFDDDAAGAESALAALREIPVALEHPLVETEVLRRRRATAISDARVHPRVNRGWAEALDWHSYAAAPAVVQGNVLAFVHADRGPGRALEVLDRDVLWEFTTALAQAYESAYLRRTLRREREQMRHFLEWVDARSSALSDAALDLLPTRLPALPDADPVERIGGSGGAPSLARLEALLTQRELEVLELISAGRANRAIADELVISEGTVKFHVNSILRKLRVKNRVEAVARYHKLTS